MKPKIHLLLGTLFSIIIYLLHPEITAINFVFLWLSTWFLIDLDYPIIYSLKNKSISPIKFLDYYNKRLKIWKTLNRNQKGKYKYNVRFFHSLEFLVLLAILSLASNFWTYLLIGFSFHLVCDWIDLLHKKENVLKKVFLIYVIVSNRKRKEFNPWKKAE